MRVLVLFVCGFMVWCIDCCCGFNYCSLSCNGVKHTMCQYQENNSCGKSGLTKSEKQIILRLHNLYRQKVATGKELRGPQPPAANMKVLAWSSESAKIAQRWASQCTEVANGHDMCRISSDGTQVGQNIAEYIMWGMKPNRNDTIVGMLKDWYEEVKNFPPSLVKSLRMEGVSQVGHYTQLVWANTSYVGCGLLMSNDASQYSYHMKLVCNYKPAGNVISYPLYQVGKPCSACHSLKCSSRYPGLCS